MIVAAPIEKPLSYKTSVPVDVGQFVVVPLGGRDVIGVVSGDDRPQDAAVKLKSVVKVLPFRALKPEMLKFLERAAGYTMASIGMFVRLVASVSTLTEDFEPPSVIGLSGAHPKRMTPAREKVLLCLAGQSFSTGAELARACGVSASVVKSLFDEGVLHRYVPKPEPLTLSKPSVMLSEDQHAAAQELSSLTADGHSTVLLQGVTGSGKTEVYLERVTECLKAYPDSQVLILLPEIALSVAFAQRLQDRYGDSVKQWHSGLSLAQRRSTWEGVNKGDIRLVIGARSALFLPFPNLRLLIVDEEHDGGYKQEDVVLYNARDMAVLYGAIHDVPVVLSSATPSLETWVNANTGKYKRVILPERFGAAVMPQLEAIDLRETKLLSGRWITQPLRDAIQETLERKEQSLLFLNRRGYAPLTLCRSCGYRLECRQCSAWLVEHRSIGKMLCHQCGQTSPVPKVCPDCHKDSLAACGPGIERLEEEVKELFPNARLAVLSSDLFPSNRALQDRIQEIGQGAYDIIIGTQLVAKGYTFPELTLVGVVDADLGLQGTDLRAAERTFQVLQQVAGRAGRVEKQGRALLQTTCPDHPVLQALLTGQAESFWSAEAEQRKAANVAPYFRMAGVILSGKFLDQVWAVGRALAQTPIESKVSILGPAQAPLGLLRGKHRVRLLLKAPRGVNLQLAIENWLSQVKVPSAVRAVIDIDPQSFL